MTKLSLNEIGHWKYPYKFDPKDYFGFLYCIENKITKQFYIGRKQFFRQGKKRSKTYGQEMPWKFYQGSSTHLKADIAKYGEENFVFEIIDLYKYRGGLNYAEAWSQMVLECMTERLDDNVTPRFINRQIAAIRWVPKEELTKRTRSFVKNLKRRY